MYDWILEADVARLREALDEVTDSEHREQLIVQLRAAETKLGIARQPVEQAHLAPAKAKSKDRFGGKSLWERSR